MSTRPPGKDINDTSHFHANKLKLGPWEIYFSSHALSDVKKYTKETNTLNSIIKKLVHLSWGTFDRPSVAKCLTSSAKDVPIYEAKPLSDLRIVWQVAISEEETCFKQYVLIWAFESHNSLGRKRVENLTRGYWLRGPDHIKMCAARVGNPPVPQVFLKNKNQEKKKQKVPDFLSTITDEEKTEIHMLLMMCKEVKFDKELLIALRLGNPEGSTIFRTSSQERAVIESNEPLLAVGRSGSGKTTCILHKMYLYQTQVVEALESDQKLLFVTQSEVLSRKVDDAFQKLFQTYKNSQLSLNQIALLSANSFNMAHQIGSGNLSHYHPRGDAFSLLKQDDFPLCTSYDQFLTMLEKDLGLFVIETGDHLYEVETSLFKNNNIVTLETFIAWWANFNQAHTKGLDVVGVFSEILGIIKGSVEASETTDGRLTREDYLKLGEKVAPLFVGRREHVYDIFLQYQLRKNELRKNELPLQDAADRSFAIYRALQKRKADNQLRPLQVSFLFVDEAQDLLLLDYQLLRMLCLNPSGIMCVGDTAQTISSGSSFRFQDLSASWWVAEQKEAAEQKREPVEMRKFELTQNYRSHGGITRCANAIVKALTNFFPYSIDKCEEEQSLVDGPSPLWIQNTTNQSFKTFFSDDSQEDIEFGVKQCIIVRDEETRKVVEQQFDDSNIKCGAIFTVLECKGLEFESVLLFDFFAECPTPVAHWRTLLSIIEEDKLQESLLQFNSFKHASIKKELQQLYVAITRARKHVWIYESTDRGQYVMEYLRAANALQIHQPGERLPRITEISTAEEWEELAWELFQRKSFREAGSAFKRSGKKWHVKMCQVEASLAQVKTLIAAEGQESPKSIKALTQIASKIEILADDRECYAKDRRRYYLHAAECLERAKQWSKAADIYLKAQEFSNSAILYRRGDNIDAAVDVVEKYHHYVPQKVRTSTIRAGKIHYGATKQVEKCIKLHEENTMACRSFLEMYEFVDTLHSLFKKLNDFLGLAGLAEARGEFLEALELLLEGNGTEEAVAILPKTFCVMMPLGNTEEKIAFSKRMLQLKPGLVPKSDKFVALLMQNSKKLPSIVLNNLDSLSTLSEQHRVMLLDETLFTIQDDRVNIDFPLEGLIMAIEQYASWAKSVLLSHDFETSHGTLPRIFQHLFGIYPSNDVGLVGSEPPEYVRWYIPRKGSFILSRYPDSDHNTIVFKQREIRWIIKKTLHERIFEVLCWFHNLAYSLRFLNTECLYHKHSKCTIADCTAFHMQDERDSSRRISNVLSIIKLIESLRWLFLPHYSTIDHNQFVKMMMTWKDRLLILLEPQEPILGRDIATMMEKVDVKLQSQIHEEIVKNARRKTFTSSNFASPFFLSSFLASHFVLRQLDPSFLVRNYRIFPSSALEIPGSLLNRGTKDDREAYMFSISETFVHGVAINVEPLIAIFSSLCEFGEKIQENWEEYIAIPNKSPFWVDLASFLPIVEEIGTLLVLSSRLRNQQDSIEVSLHGLIYPSQLLRVILGRYGHQQIGKFSDGLLNKLINNLGSLACLLYEDHHKFRHSPCWRYIGKSLSPIGTHIMVSRIIQFLALIGINHRPLQATIVDICNRIGVSKRKDYRSHWVDNLWDMNMEDRSWATLQKAFLDPRRVYQTLNKVIMIRFSNFSELVNPPWPMLASQIVSVVSLDKLYLHLGGTAESIPLSFHRQSKFTPSLQNTERPTQVFVELGDMKHDSTIRGQTKLQDLAARVIQKFLREAKRVLSATAIQKWFRRMRDRSQHFSSDPFSCLVKAYVERAARLPIELSNRSKWVALTQGGLAEVHYALNIILGILDAKRKDFIKRFKANLKQKSYEDEDEKIELLEKLFHAIKTTKSLRDRLIPSVATEAMSTFQDLFITVQVDLVDFQENLEFWIKEFNIVIDSQVTLHLMKGHATLLKIIEYKRLNENPQLIYPYKIFNIDSLKTVDDARVLWSSAADFRPGEVHSILESALSLENI